MSARSARRPLRPLLRGGRGRAEQRSQEAAAAADEARRDEAHARVLAERQAGQGDVRARLHKLEVGRAQRFSTHRQYDGMLLVLLAGVVLGPPALVAFTFIVRRSGRGDLFDWDLFWVGVRRPCRR